MKEITLRGGTMMGSLLQDNFDLWLAHDNDHEEWLQRRPVCACCGEHIQEDYVSQIGGEYYGDGCLEDLRVYIGD